MFEPTLLIVAGCNGSGKSSFSRLLVPGGFMPFDYDKYFLKFYATLFDSDIKDVMAHNLAFAELERQINDAIKTHRNFCYETNFNSTPMHWPELFRQNGYRLHLIYLCLDSIEEAKRRVAVRVENGGHYVPENEIKKRYFEGFSNLNSIFKNFDMVDIFDTSAFAGEPQHILSIETGRITLKKVCPEYLVDLIPEIVQENLRASDC